MSLLLDLTVIRKFNLTVSCHFRHRIEINIMLEKVGALSYPKWLADTALPEVDLTCVATSGMNFLNESIVNSTSATITGLLDAIKTGCSNNLISLVLTGGYDHNNQEMGVHLVVEVLAITNM